MVAGGGQDNATTGASATVKVELQVAGPQAPETVNVTVTEPPHEEGAPELLFDKTASLQPPVKLADASQVL